MRERAEAIGARFSVNASHGAGVQVFVEYRLQAAAK
jgi:signal transduction histidine kinase